MFKQKMRISQKQKTKEEHIFFLSNPFFCFLFFSNRSHTHKKERKMADNDVLMKKNERKEFD